MTTHIATSVAELITLTRTGPDEFRGPSPGKPDWIYGGQVAAQALAAASATVPDGRDVHAIRAEYLRRGQGVTPVEYTVTRLRDGGAFSARQVIAAIPPAPRAGAGWPRRASSVLTADSSPRSPRKASA